ncbi:Uncharacterized protein APZ42_006979 [Daphnia magna]|uniref:Uncharacterized protein n=1 Tax=Daphnia magna TaxID=35525 RepID=A0A164FKY3_9CRUS|nr:Uncharacterized protein APZ42_006979 [Daphnia magna]
MEKECLALVWAVKKFHSYSTHTKFGNTTSFSALLTRRLTGRSVCLFYLITHV